MRRLLTLFPLLAACTLVLPFTGDAPSSDAGTEAEAEPDGCVPTCEGRQCGDDGCGGECPPGCVGGQVCGDDSTCCTPTDCGSDKCDPEGCGRECECPTNYLCNPVTGTCCPPTCTDRECGTNGCGGECPPGCAEGQVCDQYYSCCTPDCEGRECGPDGCGGLCPMHCAEGQVCDPSNRCCTPNCEGLECGLDGCGQACPAECPSGRHCNNSSETCVPNPIWSQVAVETRPSARHGHAMALDSDRDVVLLFGGLADSALSDLWEYGEGDWTEITTTTRVPAARTPAMAYDSTRQVLVVFGGRHPSDNELALDHTFEFDGVDWESASPVATPPGRWAHAMAFDQDRGVVVLFGGTIPAPGSGDGYLDDTWEYDDSGWTQITSSPHPAARRGHVLEWDSERHVIVLHGGSRDEPGSKVDLGDTWEYDGSGWRQIETPNSPPPAWERAMAYDSTRNVMVLFGGNDRSGVGEESLSDMWEYDGLDWVEILGGLRPQGRWRHEMAFYPPRGQVVLFGGYNRDGDGIPLTETWVAAL